MNETKLDEASEKTSLFHSSRNNGTGVNNAGPNQRDTWRATTSRLFLQHHHNARPQPARPKTHHHLYRHHHYHHLHNKHTTQRDEESPHKHPAPQQRCSADQSSSVHQQHKQILLHHHNPDQQSQSPAPQRKYQPSYFHAPYLHRHFHRHHSPLLPSKQRRKRHLQLTHGLHRSGSSSASTVAESSTIQVTTTSTRPTPVAPCLTASSECPHCGSRGDPLLYNQYQHPYTQHYQHRQALRTGLPTTSHRNNTNTSGCVDGATPKVSSGAGAQHCCGRAHTPPTSTADAGGIITTTSVSECKHLPAISDDHIVFIWDSDYCRSFQGIVRILQVILSVISLICLTTAGRKEGGYLSLPLCWHFRIMVFVLVLTLMSSFVIWAAHVTGVASAFPVNWPFLDMVVYSAFAFLYLVGASLVASAFDFYEKMQVAVEHHTIQQLIICVIIGYICLFLYGTTAILGYRQWRIQMNQYQRRNLLEEDDFEI